jgi:hypothetical protein
MKKQDTPTRARLRKIVPPCDGCPLVQLCATGVVCEGFMYWVRNVQLRRARTMRGQHMQSADAIFQEPTPLLGTRRYARVAK